MKSQFIFWAVLNLSISGAFLFNALLTHRSALGAIPNALAALFLLWLAYYFSP